MFCILSHATIIECQKEFHLCENKLVSLSKDEFDNTQKYLVCSYNKDNITVNIFVTEIGDVQVYIAKQQELQDSLDAMLFEDLLNRDNNNNNHYYIYETIDYSEQDVVVNENDNDI